MNRVLSIPAVDAPKCTTLTTVFFCSSPLHIEGYVLIGTDPKNAWYFRDGSVDLVRETSESQVIQIPAESHPIRMDLNRTALIVIDMQRFFCEPDDGQPSRNPIAPLQALIPGLRGVGAPVVWVNWGNRPDEANLPPGVHYTFNTRRLEAPQPFLTQGTETTQIVPELPTTDDDVFVDKYRISGFWDTPLDSILRNKRIDTLLFAGVNLDQCVFQTLMDAHFLGYDCVLLRDCCATGSPEYCVEATYYNTKGVGFIAESSAILAEI